MGLIVILAVVGVVALGSWFLYRRPKSVPTDLPDASLHIKDDVLDHRAVADQFRQGTQGPWG